MDLKKRLASLDRLSRVKGGGRADAEPVGDTTETLFSLGLIETDGRLWAREYRDELPAPSRNLPDLEGFFTRTGPEGLLAEDLLFLDTETTGLAGGTGTIPFLVGVAWWSRGHLVTRQFFMPGPGRESPMLSALEELARQFKVVVTFNGASFDLPLLRTRARLDRRDDPLASLVSWDLLVPARRLWGNALPNCRQQTLEVAICGQKRLRGDIDGSRIPQSWFDFLATGRPGDLPEVRCHNHRDMKGMALLFKKVVESAHLTERPTSVGSASWREAWSMGRICEKRRKHALALKWLETSFAAARLEGGGVLSTPCFLRDSVRVLKRGGDWHQVEDVITAGFEAGLKEPWLHREAAILYEHRLVRLDQALHHARQSGEESRVRRLERRLTHCERAHPAPGRKAGT